MTSNPLLVTTAKVEPLMTVPIARFTYIVILFYLDKNGNEKIKQSFPFLLGQTHLFRKT